MKSSAESENPHRALTYTQGPFSGGLRPTPLNLNALKGGGVLAMSIAEWAHVGSQLRAQTRTPGGTLWGGGAPPLSHTCLHLRTAEQDLVSDMKMLRCRTAWTR